MAKRMTAPASTMHLAGAEVKARNGLKFAFTCKALSDGSPRTIYVSVRITANGEASVCDFEERRELPPGMDQDAAMLFPDSDGVDESTLEGYCLADFVSRTQ